MLSRTLAALVCALPLVVADTYSGVPDPAPAGYEEWTSPIVTPAKNISGDGGWDDALAKARAFVGKLTLAEKINITTGVDVQDRCVGNTGSIPRLGFRELCLEDSPLGVRFADFVSAFPAGITVASTWDRDLMYNRGKAMGAEHRGKGVNIALGPMMNLGRVAAGGRNWEGFGADPFLAGVAAAQTIQGMQSTGVMANAKHLIGNEQEHYRGGSEATQIQSSNIDDRTLHELYAWPFAESINAGVATIMCSYNSVNQTQMCQNSKILNGLIKEELDFQGPIISDWAALIDGIQPALAGADMNMPGFRAYGQGPQGEGNPVVATNGWWGANLIDMVHNGTVPEWRVDDMVTRTIAAWYKLGQDSGYPDINFSQLTQQTYLNGQVVNTHVNVQEDHYKLIRQIGAASTVLLKNTKKALPLKLSSLKRIGVFGSDAGPNPDGANGCNDRGCDQGTLAMGWGSGTANFPYLIDPAAALNAYIQAHQPTTVVDVITSDFNYNAVRTSAALADACLVFANADSGEGYISVDGNAGDRNNLTLWHGADTLIANTAAVCANTVVVMHTVGPVLVEAWISHPNVTAVLAAHLPGQETGNAIVDVLFGAVNPSGRLPYTIAKQRADYPADVLYSSSMTSPQITYSEGLEIDYRHFDANGIAPRFEFGFGLSYTTFSYSELSIRAADRRRGVSPEPESHKTSTLSAPASSVPASSAPPSSAPVSSTLSASTKSSKSKSTKTKSTSTASALSASVSSVASSTITSAPVSGSGSASGSASASGSGSRSGSGSLSGTLASSGSGSLSGSRSASVNATSTRSAPPSFSSPAQTRPGGPAALYDDLYTVSFVVRNSGGVDGYEVSQVYVTFPDGAGEPPKVLRGFEKTFVGAGEQTSVDVVLRRKDLSVWDVVQQKWVVPSGSFTISVGSSSRAIHLTAEFEV